MTRTGCTRYIPAIKAVFVLWLVGLYNGHKISGGSPVLYISIMFYFLSQVKNKLRLFEQEWMIIGGKAVMMFLPSIITIQIFSHFTHDFVCKRILCHIQISQFYKRKCTGCLTEKPNAPNNVCGHLRNPLSRVEA